MTLPEHTNPPGKSNATASLVLGIIAVVFWFFGYSSILSVILGIVGLIQAQPRPRNWDTWTPSARRDLCSPSLV